MAIKLKPKGRDQYVVPHNNGWAVKNAGSTKPWRVVKTLGEATVLAMYKAGENRSDFKIFGTDHYVTPDNPKHFERYAK